MLEQIIEVVVHTFLAITSMFLLTKTLGKRQLSEISLFGYISGITIGNIAAYIALEEEKRYWALLSLVVWVMTTLALEKLTMKSEKIRHVIDNIPTLLVENGIVYRDAFAKENITVDEFMQQLHDHDVYRIEDVETATIEASGDVTVLLKTSVQPLTAAMLGIEIDDEHEPVTIIIDRVWQHKKIGEKHLRIDHIETVMNKHNIKLEQVFIAQAYSKDSFYFCFMDGSSKKISKEKENSVMTIEELQQTLVKLNQFLQKQT